MQHLKKLLLFCHQTKQISLSLASYLLNHQIETSLHICNPFEFFTMGAFMFLNHFLGFFYTKYFICLSNWMYNTFNTYFIKMSIYLCGTSWLDWDLKFMILIWSYLTMRELMRRKNFASNTNASLHPLLICCIMLSATLDSLQVRIKILYVVDWQRHCRGTYRPYMYFQCKVHWGTVYLFPCL